MTVEDALKDAMSAHVADVHAPPSLGRAVRRGHRAHVVRFRTAGAALVTAAVAIAVPITLSPSGPSVAGTDRAVVTVTVPDLLGMDVAEGEAALKAAGLVPVVTGEGVISVQSPARGAQVEQGTQVSISATAPPVAGQPQDLGDLGDGRTFGGIHLGYLPKGLVWSKWSGKDGFGETSYTTSFGEEGTEEGLYSIQVVVYEGEAAKRPKERLDGLPDTSEHITQVDGVRMYLAELGEDSQPAEDGTPTISWMLRDDLSVEVMMSPDRSATMEWAEVQIELTKIAQRVRPSK